MSVIINICVYIYICVYVYVYMRIYIYIYYVIQLCIIIINVSSIISIIIISSSTISIIIIIIIIIIIMISYHTRGTHTWRTVLRRPRSSVYGRFPKFHRVFLGRDPGTLNSDIVSTKTSTINSFGFETLKLKIRRLKSWKPTVYYYMRE